MDNSNELKNNETKINETKINETKINETIIKLKNDNFWSNDLSILTRKDRLIEFLPTRDMTTEERLNALTRLTLYISVVLMAYLGKGWPLYLGFIGMAFTYMLYMLHPKPKSPPKYAPDETPGIDDPNPFIPSEQPICTAPTLNNPFMNVLNNEYVDNPTRPAACEYSEVKEDLEQGFHYNLYQDLGDNIWEKNNSQRQFFTMPYTTIPNNQGDFARWLYRVGPVCKQNQEACYRYEDLRANRSVVGTQEPL